MNHYKQPDALRGIFTMFVVASHWLPHAELFPESGSAFLTTISVIGEIGMYFFFVLSGFLISGILLSNRLQADVQDSSKFGVWKNFFFRRTLRIFPIYYAVLLVLFFFNINWFRGPAGWHFSYLSNFYFYQRNEFGLGGHLWSLSAEEQFYVLWPILMLFVPLRHIKKMIVLMVLIAPAFRAYMNQINPSGFTQLLTPAVLDGFGLGALLACWAKLPKKSSQGINVISFADACGVAGILLIAAFYIKPFDLHIWSERTIFYDIFFRSAHALLGVFFVARSVKGFGGVLRPILTNSVALYLGKISYGLYLFHNLQLYIFQWFKLPVPTTGVYLLFHLALLIAVSALSWHFFESPINNLKKYFPYLKPVKKNVQDDMNLEHQLVGLGAVTVAETSSNYKNI